MAKIDLLSREWSDLIFKGKNKNYGAYELRIKSPKRHIIALITVIVLVAVAVSFTAVASYIVSRQDKVVITEVTQLTQLPPAEVKNNDEIKKVEAPPPPPLKSSIKFTAPKIEKDENVREEDEIKSQEEIIEAKVAVSIADVKGNDEENGQDIAELREITQEVEEEEPYTAVEEMPQFPGGDKAMYDWLYEHLEYPYSAQERGISGNVWLRFVVSKEGKVERVEVARGIDPACDKEAQRVVASMPDWIPGRQNGRNVPVYYTIRVVFQLKK